MPTLRLLAPALAFTAAASLAAAQTAPMPPPKVREACAADFQKLCPDVQPGRGAVMQCMRSHFQEVSPECHSAVMAHRAEMRARRPGEMQSETPAPVPPS